MKPHTINASSFLSHFTHTIPHSSYSQESKLTDQVTDEPIISCIDFVPPLSLFLFKIFVFDIGIKYWYRTVVEHLNCEPHLYCKNKMSKIDIIACKVNRANSLKKMK